MMTHHQKWLSFTEVMTPIEREQHNRESVAAALPIGNTDQDTVGNLLWGPVLGNFVQYLELVNYHTASW